MVTWEIFRDGTPYSRVLMERGATEESAIEEWKKAWAWRSGHQSMEAVCNGRVITARRYVSSRLDNYGTRRGG